MVKLSSTRGLGKSVDHILWRIQNIPMGEEDRNKLLNTIKDLNDELAAKDEDLKRYREELTSANSQLEKLIVDLNRDIKTINHIHKLLVPTDMPNITGFEFSSKFLPSSISGGDYLDIFSHQDRLRFGILLSSASGYGASSLLLSILLKLTGQLEARKNNSVDGIISNIIAELTPNLGGAESVDLFYSLVDRRQFEMSYCLLGQVYGFVQTYSNNELINLGPSQSPIQVGFNEELKIRQVGLNPKDRLILLSKGFVEAQNIQGQAFGVDGLLRALTSAPRQGVHELRNHLLMQLETFTGGQSFKRDITIIVSEVNDRVIKLAKK